jgi:hypothetical protein
VNGSTYKRCGCRDANGRLLGQKCPKLRSTKHGAWYYLLRVAGRPHPYKRGGFTSAREANSALDDLRGRLRGGQTLHRQTVGEWLDEWIASKRRLRPDTARSYAGHVDRYLRPQLGHLPLESLSVGHLATMFEAITAGNVHRDRPVGPTTMHRVSSRGESHPPALAEPDMNLSTHPAPIIQPSAPPPANERTVPVGVP